MRKSFLLIVSVVYLFIASSAWGLPTMAILPFESENEGTLAKTASELFQSAVFKSKFVNLIEREKLEVIIKEQALSLTGLTTSDANKIGNLLNVDYTCIGKLNKLKQGYTLSSRVIDVKTGDILFSDTVQFAVSSQLEEAINIIHDGLKIQITGTTSPSSQSTMLKNKQKLLVDPNAKTVAGATWRSLVCPGLGQFYNKQTIPGILFIASEGFMVMGLTMKIMKIEPPTGEIPASAAVIGLTLGVLHSLNIIHAYAFSPYHKKSENTMLLTPTLENNKLALKTYYQIKF